MRVFYGAFPLHKSDSAVFPHSLCKDLRRITNLTKHHAKQGEAVICLLAHLSPKSLRLAWGETSHPAVAPGVCITEGHRFFTYTGVPERIVQVPLSGAKRLLRLSSFQTLLRSTGHMKTCFAQYDVHSQQKQKGSV